ncbi:IQ domain-containing protein H [Stylophora pistillata]|uniref:IQ domain-containing protein H n=1 Tax=Stylophora pistillata TaxID=50429 RepID=A0A2B4REW1_STYPI|nr:IQ domain-containing protein H [Stylophora pistillata]
MFSLTDIQPGPTDIGEILVKDKAEQIIHSTNNQVLTLPSLEGPVTGSTKSKQQEAVGNQRMVAFKRNSSPQKTSFRSLLEPIAIAKEGNKPGPNAPAPGKQARDLRNLKILSNPAHPEARNILSERYGIALPYIVDKHEQPAQPAAELTLQPSPVKHHQAPHFLTCILNADDVEKIIKTPGRRYLGPRGTEMAAVKIQSTWRRYKDRSAYLLYRKRKWAAGVIAISWIMSCKISMVRKQLKATRKLQLKRFKVRAKAFQEAWPRIKDSRRVVIHIPSLGYAQHIRDELSEIKILQNLQMARLCDIADPKVEVIYISPVELNDEVYQYYSKLLAMKARRLEKNNSESKGNGEEDEDIENRYKIIVPDAVNRFPTHNMCLSSILKYSPRTVKRLRNLIKGRDAYIVPGVLHKDDIYLADLLDIPVLSPEPEVASLYSTKSGSKRIFLSAKVEIPPGHFDIYSLPQLHESLAELVTENLHIKRWLFKMDNEFDGRGTAFCDVTPYLKCYSWAVKECQRYGEKWNKKWAHEPTLIRVSAEIPEIIAHHATPVSSDLYPTWDKFLQDFLKRGGVIEACPSSDSVTTLSVDVLIEPTGETTVLSMADQIHATSPFRCWGYSVPQTSVDPPVLCTAADAVSNACKLRGIVGYFSIDFVTFIDPKSLEQVVWAVDLKLRYSDSMAMTKLMLYVSGGEFQAPQSSFVVPVKKKQEESGRRKRRKTFEEEEPPPNPNRFAILSTRLLHSNLSVIHYSVFFQMCRAHGIGFDMKEKAGTIFTLVDSSKREHLGMFVMSDDLQGSLSTFARNLSVIHQEISAPNMQGESNFQAAIDDIDSILGTTEENKKNPSIPCTKSPQLHAPRPKEMQRILQEHQQQMHAIEKDKKEMEEEKEKQRLAEEHRRSSQMEGRVQTGQSSAPPPTPAAGISPAGSTAVIEETPVTTRAASVVSGVSNALTSYEVAQTSSGSNVAAESEEVSTDPPHSSGDILNDCKTLPESVKEHHIQRSLSSPSGPAPKDNLREEKRAPSVKMKTRTPYPREDGKGKRSLSAKK